MYAHTATLRTASHLITSSSSHYSTTQPVYIQTKDLSKVKRVVISQPGAPRDTWAYARYLANALLCATARENLNVDDEEVLIVAPAWLGQGEKQAGAAKANDM